MNAPRETPSNLPVATPAPVASPLTRFISPRLKFALAVALLFAVVVAITAAGGIALWSRFPAELKLALGQALDDAAGLVVLFAAFLLAAVGLLVDVAFRAYVGGVNRLAEGARIIVTANPAHQLSDDGPAEVVRLAALINGLAERYRSALAEVEVRVQEANAKLEEEKHRLAALMSELTDSVLVCNAEGLILLYNATARSLFNHGDANDGASTGIVGLGRSVFG